MGGSDILMLQALAEWRGIPLVLRKSMRDSFIRGLQGLKTPEPITLNEWAERHFYLSAESSQGEQRWESFPYQRVMLCAIGDDEIEEVTVRKSARTGFTKMLLASIAFDAHHRRRNQALWQPTDADSDEFCKSEIEPMLRDVKAMQDVFPKFMAKSKHNTLQMKKFLGSILYLKGGTSSGNYRRMTLQSARLDEFDAFDQKIDKSADPFTLAWKRLEGATFPKLVAGSTPRLKGQSHIERREGVADARMRFNIVCPHCQLMHPLMPGRLSFKSERSQAGIQWDDEDPQGTVRHVCPHCRGSIRQHEYFKIADAGVWVSDDGVFQARHAPYQWTDDSGDPLIKAPRHVAFHVWTAYSPMVTWATLVREHLEAKKSKDAGDSAPAEGYTNETLGELWEAEVEKAESHQLLARAENYPMRSVPHGGLVLHAGVDVQDRRWEVTVWAFGRGEEMWPIDYQVIDGNPSEDSEWDEKLLPYLKTKFDHAGGAQLGLHSVAVDTGGHFTHQTYAFCRRHQKLRFYAIKGEARDRRPIKSKATLQDINFSGRIIKKGIKLWLVGTDTAKDLFFGRLKVAAPGPGFVHFNKHFPLEWFNGLTAEARKTVKTSKGETTRWVKVAQRNEPLDTTVYALFCAVMMDLDRYTEAQWRQLEHALVPPPKVERDVQEQPQAKKKQAASKVSKRVPTAASQASAGFAKEEWSSRL